MTHLHDPSVILSDLSFTWPDGTPALRGITATFGPGRTGLTGANGTGKSTLLRLIGGQLRPTAGTVSVTGTVGHLPQRLTTAPDAQVADLLGIRRTLDALRAVEAGDADPRHFEAVGADWDIETRARAALDALGLPGIGLDRPAREVSGGEAVLIALTGLRLAGDDVVLLDEPTNNLDLPTRRRLYDMVLDWRGALIVVSHDTALLELMDATAELHRNSLHIYGGPYSHYREQLAAQQAAAEQSLRSAEQSLKQEKRQRIEAETKLARRARYARTDYANKRKPKIVMNQRKTEAQVSAGRLRGELDSRLEDARQAVAEKEGQVRRDGHIRIQLPDPDVPTGRRIATLGEYTVQGPEKLALTGPNGVGKTRLLEDLIHGRAGVLFTDRVGYLPQRLDHLDDSATVLESVPAASVQAARAGLARFLFTGAEVDRTVGELSGGERFRVALAALLLTDPPNQVLVLDEPTNNLDLDSVAELVSALSSYRGALIVVSHDLDFLQRLGITTWLELSPASASSCSPSMHLCPGPPDSGRNRSAGRGNPRPGTP